MNDVTTPQWLATVAASTNVDRLELPPDPKEGTAVAPVLYKPDPGITRRRQERKRQRQDRCRGRGERG